MVSPRPGHLPLSCLLRTCALGGLLATLSLGCATYSDPALESEDWVRETRETAVTAAKVTMKGAQVAGSAMGTAVHGVVNGFEAPRDGTFGAYPRDYADAIRSHLRRFEGVPTDASLRFGRPGKGYLNKGILAGGGVAWQGYLVRVEVTRSALFSSQARPERYVVRMRDGEVLEVLEADYAGALRWVERGETGVGVAAPAR